MRIRALTVGVVATLVIGATPALAFQETPEAPPEVLQLTPDAKDPTMQLQSPATSPAQASTDKSGTKLFGFSVLPKLDFGLELLYSAPQPPDLQQGTLPDDNQDLTVLGKVKRHF
jgi:hypothetical protein